mmetsp:Transcript_36983/g.75394  ORF Transcript_36983/g.75394 Transcript_36983/m.75394 type:complete len:113 (+) Transcript_36983:2137-2475(+)
MYHGIYIYVVKKIERCYYSNTPEILLACESGYLSATNAPTNVSTLLKVLLRAKWFPSPGTSTRISTQHEFPTRLVQDAIAVPASFKGGFAGDSFQQTLRFLLCYANQFCMAD